MTPSKWNVFLGSALGAAAIAAVAASTLASDQRTDQAHRDLTRVFSEVYQRAMSHDQIGEVARPEFASAKVDISVPDLSETWAPTCDFDIAAAHSDPRRNLQALVMVPRDGLSPDGTDFTVFAVFHGAPVVSDALFANPPDWLLQDTGGYDSLAPDLSRITSGSDIAVTSIVCPDFTVSTIEGTPK